MFRQEVINSPFYVSNILRTLLTATWWRPEV